MAPPIGGGRKITTEKMITRFLWTDEGRINAHMAAKDLGGGSTRREV